MRFWEKVKKTAGCWIWTAAKDKDGYGTFGKPSKRAHRISFALALSREPVGMVLHRCDNPPCVNPEHLFEGTAKRP